MPTTEYIRPGITAIHIARTQPANTASGVVRHENWCITRNEAVSYAYEAVLDAEKLSLGDRLILHALGVALERQGVRWTLPDAGCSDIGMNYVVRNKLLAPIQRRVTCQPCFACLTTLSSSPKAVSLALSRYNVSGPS